MNTCDKCKAYTSELVWITSEDFSYKEGESLPDEVFEKYDALCEWCYDQELSDE